MSEYIWDTQRGAWSTVRPWAVFVVASAIISFLGHGGNLEPSALTTACFIFLPPCCLYLFLCLYLLSPSPVYKASLPANSLLVSPPGGSRYHWRSWSVRRVLLVDREQRCFIRRPSDHRQPLCSACTDDPHSDFSLSGVQPVTRNQHVLQASPHPNVNSFEESQLSMRFMKNSPLRSQRFFSAVSPK